MTLYAPNGNRIVGTLERVYGVAGIQDVVGLDPDTGGFELEHDGETEVDWDSQETVTRSPLINGEIGDPERVFVDTDGLEWPESQLTLKTE